MSQKPRGRDPKQQWGGGGGGNNNNSGNSRRGPSGQNAPAAGAAAPNFTDANAFGPPLGGRARPNRQGGKCKMNKCLNSFVLIFFSHSMVTATQPLNYHVAYAVGAYSLYVRSTGLSNRQVFGNSINALGASIW